ncbi:Gfo/Idh/MocA family oxidoreductase [Ilyomonas limi]|uniref:Gfo/Idh/MocA family oxidoreductase n=1 Tax=Ilyomonas limi TaxID=2575867 RepID=A0A4U3L2L0_9BACT|nr:Gfo/Idh/MocA family oxidoreductase [Ilyomonas limi]TKK69258.1 Gfo/Idh/MocA family oxidoreductase [Ilyomonas limi]
MKKETEPNVEITAISNEKSETDPANNNGMHRRKFVELTASAALAFTIIPRHVLGKGFIPPSDKVTLAYIGVGTQGIRELLPLLSAPEIQVVAVCDPNKEAIGYRDWGTTYLRDEIRKAIKKPDWMPGGDNVIPGGRDNGKDIVDTYYANVRSNEKFKGCTAYEDARELLDKEKDLDAVKIMTPDHLHGVLSMAAIKRGKHVLVHKPISNRLTEGKKLIEMARNNPKVITHLIPWDYNGSMEQVMAWIKGGAIGKLTEVHNWTNRPVWPQYPELPTDKPQVPQGFNWDLWLGPEADRPYHPNYTNMVFRGWYDFGGGSMADMGHYSLWTVFNALQLTSPTIVEPHRSHVCDFNGAVPFRVNNDFSFPMASTVRFKYPANSNRGPVDLYWYDGGMRPEIPEELANDGKELPAEGMMFVGEEGKILAGFNVQDPQIISGKKMDKLVSSSADNQNEGQQALAALSLFVQACKTGRQYPGNFSEAEYITEAVNLYAAALRANRLLKYDAANMKITNVPEANKYLSREYRQGWDPASI